MLLPMPLNKVLSVVPKVLNSAMSAIPSTPAMMPYSRAVTALRSRTRACKAGWKYDNFCLLLSDVGSGYPHASHRTAN